MSVTWYEFFYGMKFQLFTVYGLYKLPYSCCIDLLAGSVQNGVNYTTVFNSFMVVLLDVIGSQYFLI